MAQLTTFRNETLLYRHPNGEALVEVSGSLEPERNRRFYVAVTRDGYRTDYPLWTGTGVVWDNPEYFTRSFRIAATKHIADIKQA